MNVQIFSVSVFNNSNEEKRKKSK